MLKVFVRLKVAARHERVGNADNGGVSESHSDVEIIIFLQKGIVNDVENIPLMVVPVFVSELCGNALKLEGKAIRAGNIIVALQHGGHAVKMLLLQFPKVTAAGKLPAAGVGHIEHIFQTRFIRADIYKGDASRAAPHIAPHTLIPKIILRTGSSVGTLGVNHYLFIIGVFVQPRGGSQKRFPVF